jgi:hypothetical protein
MRIGRRWLGWGRVVALLSAIAALLAPTAALGSRPRSPQGADVRMVVHASGPFTTTGRYRSSLQGPVVAARTVSSAADAATGTSRSSAAPTSVGGFPGIPQVDPFEPSDTIGALGVTYFLTAVNTSYALWNRDGTQAIAPTPLTTLTTQDDGLDVFDPKIVYDAYTDTFVMAYLAQRDSPRGSLIVLTSIPDATATDPSTWCIRAFQGDQVPADQVTWADYPALGFDQDRVTISTNEFTFPSTFGRFAYAQVISFPKTSLYDCSANLVGTVFAGTQTANPDGSKAFTIQPASTVGASSSSQFLLSFEGPGKGSFLTVWRLRAGSTGLQLKKAALDVGTVKGNVVGTQAGGSLTSIDTAWDTGDQRLINAWYDGDRHQLYAAHNVAKDLVPDTITGSYVESVVRWYEVDPAGKLRKSSLARKGIVGEAETDAGWPAVATDGAGNLWITFSRASEPKDEFLSAWAAEVPPGSTTASMLLVVPGTAVHNSLKGLERWGDFNGINRDPTDPTRIAMINQIAVPNSEWQQTVNVLTDA